MKSYDEMTDKEIADGIRKSLRMEFPDTVFRVSYNGELSVGIIGGELMKYGDNLPEEIEDRIQNAVFEIYPILMKFDESEYI